MKRTGEKPDFFIVGAPKSGTTAMYRYLKQHPEIFMPERKELHFFGTDIQSSLYVRDREKYLSFFSHIAGEKRVGEASVWYLYSKKAAHEIKEFCPTASIIIMLRNPVDMLYSLHSHFLYNGSEDIDNFQAALDAEGDRRRGQRIPVTAHFVECLFYRETVKYAQQVERYLKVFGRENVHIIIYDDLKKDPLGVYQEALTFLGVDEQFKPAFSIVNPNKSVRSKALQRFLLNPPAHTQKLLKAVLPRFVRSSVWKGLKRLNIKCEPRKPMNPDLRKCLQSEFAAEVESLGKIIGKDLSHWSRD